jgi:seryl-tRNA synthetase
MLDIKMIIDNPISVIEKLNTRGKDYSEEINNIVNFYQSFVVLSQKEDGLREEMNKMAKQIAMDPSDDNKNKARELSDEIKIISAQTKESYQEYYELALKIPNIPSDETPIGDNEIDNVVIETFGNINSNKQTLPH